MKYSIVNYQETFTAYNDYRLDADYYHADFIHLINSISKKTITTLNDNNFYITDGEHGSPCWDVNTNIKYITAENIKPNYIEENDFKTISIEQDERNKRSRLRQNDILIYSVGVFAGYAALSEPHLFPANIPRSVAIIRLKNYDELVPEYVCVFINSKYGQFQTKRLQAGNAQPMLALEKISKLRIVCLNIEFQKIIKKIYSKSYELRRYTADLYRQSLFILNKELNIINWIPEHKLWSVKNYSDVKDANRLDAEYFQPKYDEIIEKINKYPNGWNTIGNQFKQNKKSFLIDINSEYKYVEIGSINIANGEISPENIQGKNLPANAKINLQQGDILISKVRTYRGAVAIVKSTDFVGSGAFTVLHEKIDSKINKETLYVYFKLKPILDLTLKYNTGSSYPTITDEDILNMPIPIFQQEIQNSVKNNIQQAQKIQSQSKQLLEIAKRGVEIAIEQDEDIATSWINQELQKIGVEL